MVRTLRVAGELAVLDAKEISVSARRHDLHKQIDRLYLGGVADGRLLNRLEDDETRVSAQRTVLHREIDGLRAEIGMSAVRRHEITERG